MSDEPYVTLACRACRSAIKLPSDITWHHTDHKGYAKYMMHSLRMGYIIHDSTCNRCEASGRLPRVP